MAQGLGLGTPAGHSLTPKVLLNPRSHLSSPSPLRSPPASTETFFPYFLPRNPLPEAQGRGPAPPSPKHLFPTHPLLQLQALNTAFMVKHGIPFLFKTSPGSSQGQHSQPWELWDELWDELCSARGGIPIPENFGMSCAHPQRSREVTQEQGGDNCHPLEHSRSPSPPSLLLEPAAVSEEKPAGKAALCGQTDSQTDSQPRGAGRGSLPRVRLSHLSRRAQKSLRMLMSANSARYRCE